MVSPASSNVHETLDAVVTFDSSAPSGYEAMLPTSTFLLYRSPPPSDGVALRSCAQSSEEHTVKMVSSCNDSTLLGYALGDSVLGQPDQYEALVAFSTNFDQSPDNIDRALIAPSDEPTFCSTVKPYGTCHPTSFYVPK